jgi:hypothetical protein
MEALHLLLHFLFDHHQDLRHLCLEFSNLLVVDAGLFLLSPRLIVL